MSLSPRDRIGVYEIIGLLGAGGMGEVYRARDVKLDREVALKVLPDAVATDLERMARFEREARTLAVLNHPHIAQVYGFEQTAQHAALVMELVEGDDLAERLKRGPLPVDEALPIARQIAEALEAAHDAGIVHRDLKPANVKVRPDGTVKVLDFGLAKAIDPASGLGPQAPAVDNSPTITTPAMTMRGVILGTAAYMAPEQAKGKFVDRRADIWAFGCVLYEMLTGSRTFEGEDVSDTLVSVLRDDPRWQRLPAHTPPHVRRLLARCLQKDPLKRLPHIGVARLELAEAPSSAEPIAQPALARRASWMASAAWLLVGAAAATAVAAMAWPRLAAAPAPVIRFAIAPGTGEMFTGANRVPRFAVSADGRTVVFQTSDQKRNRLWLRSVDSTSAVALAGVEGSPAGTNIQQAFWSPDGNSIAFFEETEHQLKVVPRAGGTPQSLANVPGNQLGGSWSGNAIVFSSADSNGIQRVDPASRAVTQLTKVDPAQKEVSHLWPNFLADGRHFIYLAIYAEDQPSALFVASIDGGAPVRVVESPAAAISLPPDRLIYVRGTALVSQRLDPRTWTLLGEPDTITGDASFTQTGRLAASASANGVIAYASGSAEGDTYETYWVDRVGRPLAGAPPAVANGLGGMRISPDGRLLAYGRSLGFKNARQVSDVWIQDLARGIEARLTATPIFGQRSVVFSPDGRTVAYSRWQEPYGVASLSVTGAGEERMLLASDNSRVMVPQAWLAGGSRLLLWEMTSSNAGPTLSGPIVSLAVGSGERTAFLPSYFGGGLAASPDGKFVAVTEGGAAERQIFIRSVDDPQATRWVVSPQGAAQPRWRADGRELYYIDRSGMIMAVPVTLAPAVVVGTPVPLFEIPGSSAAGALGAYDVGLDGQRFVVTRPRGVNASTSITVAINWSPGRADSPTR